ncbi:LuxR C-terminal-related transcriptional regulator [Pseudomonas lini]
MQIHLEEFVHRLARGLSVKRIATERAINHKTVSTHEARLMERRTFTSMADIVRYSMKLRML